MEYRWYQYSDDGIQDAFEIRRQVFCGEVGFSEEYEFDDGDKTALHLVCYRDGRAVCTARILAEGSGVWHFGRLCAPADLRGKGHGGAAVKRAVEKCRRLGAKKVILGAKYDKKGFYEHLGFVSYGDIYSEEGIPHIMMKKSL